MLLSPLPQQLRSDPLVPRCFGSSSAVFSSAIVGGAAVRARILFPSPGEGGCLGGKQGAQLFWQSVVLKCASIRAEDTRVWAISDPQPGLLLAFEGDYCTECFPRGDPAWAGGRASDRDEGWGLPSRAQSTVSIQRARTG